MPWDNAEACQPRQPRNIQRVQVLMDLHPQCLANTSATSAWVINASASHHLVPLWKQHQQDQRDPRSIPSTTWRCPQLRSTAPHFYCKVLVGYCSSLLCPSTASPNFSQTRSVATMTARSATCSAGRYLSASEVPQANSARLDLFVSLTASLTSSVYHRVRGVPPWPILETWQLQTVPPMEVENMVHLDLMSPASLRIRSKFSLRW